jgi:hypothetical protein
MGDLGSKFTFPVMALAEKKGWMLAMYNFFCSSIDRECSMSLQRCFPAKQEDV